MAFVIENACLTLRISLTLLRIVGFWEPDNLSSNQKIIYYCYAAFTFMFLLGTYLTIQLIDLFIIFGDIALMTSTAFLLFTNLSQAAKIFYLTTNKKVVLGIVNQCNAVLMQVDNDEARRIVRSCDIETRIQMAMYFILTVITTGGWALSAEKNELPLRAWYPYDTSKSPAYELTYAYQSIALFSVAYLNVAKDTVISTLISQCRYRFKLLGLSLRTFCDDIKVKDMHLFSPEQEAIAYDRLHKYLKEHQAALLAAHDLQVCFSKILLAQFTVSLIIICVSAFQLVYLSRNLVRLLSMATYFVDMCLQLFIFCYQGSQISDESSNIADAAYACPWYCSSPRFRSAVLMMILRARRVTTITPGGITTLSLASFMSIIKASYSLFTVIRQVDHEE